MNGALVECIRSCNGLRHVNGKEIQLTEPIALGTILTIKSVIYGEEHRASGEIISEGLGYTFEEIPEVIHPMLHKLVGYPKRCFREIQPPMKIDIENLIHENTLQP